MLHPHEFRSVLGIVFAHTPCQTLSSFQNITAATIVLAMASLSSVCQAGSDSFHTRARGLAPLLGDRRGALVTEFCSHDARLQPYCNHSALTHRSLVLPAHVAFRGVVW